MPKKKKTNKKKSPKKSLKISREYFETFKESFLYWQKELGLMQYQIQFEQQILNHQYARISVREDVKFALVICNAKHTSQQAADADDGPEDNAKHEACHLLIARLEWLGNLRYIREEEIYDEDEAVVIRLARVLK